MPVQQQMSSFASKLGSRVAQANAEHKDKPVDTGNLRPPAGIKNGTAKLSSMYTKEYMDGDYKGQTFFRGSAIVMLPETLNGQKCAGSVTSVMIPLCDQPAKGERKGRTFSQNWFDFQNLFKLLGIMPPNEAGTDEAAGLRIQAYYFAAMQALTNPQRGPVYISFSTRGWTPPKTAQQPNPSEMVFEEWHGLATFDATHNPAAAVSEQPDPHSLPPNMPNGTASHTAPFNEFAPPAGAAPSDLTDEVSALIETAMNDPEGATDEGAAATLRLEELAFAAGWSKEQTSAAADWAAVGEMALNPSAASGKPLIPNASEVTTGSKWKFAKRTKEGAKLKNAKGEEFPPQEVEVVTVDAAGKTCTLKSVKDGKPVVDIRSKKPIDVKFEWLE